MDVSINMLPASSPPTSTPVATGVDPVVREEWISVDPIIRQAIADGVDLNDDPPLPPAPKFKAESKVYHRASGKIAVVLAQVVKCNNAAHKVAHEQGARPLAIDGCTLVWTGDYIVSADWGSELIAPEAELIETAGG